MDQITLDLYRALQDAQRYILFPVGIAPRVTVRVATHKMPVADFNAMTAKIATALNAASKIHQAGQ